MGTGNLYTVTRQTGALNFPNRSIKIYYTNRSVKIQPQKLRLWYVHVSREDITQLLSEVMVGLDIQCTHVCYGKAKKVQLRWVNKNVAAVQM